MPQTASVRGANGINLYLTATEPGAIEDLVSCQNIDLSVRRAVLPRLGLGRPSGWQGLIYTSGGELFANDFYALSGDIVSMCAGGGLLVDAPSVAA